MSKHAFMTVTILLLLGLVVGTAGAINAAYPVKVVELGEKIPHAEAYNLDPYNIVPADTVAICWLYEQENYNLARGDYRYLLNCIGRDPVDPDGTKFRRLGEWMDSHDPAPVGEYYAVSNTSPIGDWQATLEQIQSKPQAFRDAHFHLYTVLPDPIPTTAPTPVPTIGSIKISSNPSGASIFLDNALKGITPLTLNDVTNGAHVVLLRYNGYQDYSTTVNILGDISTINPTLEKISSSTSTLTSTQTTVAPTVTTTTPQFTLTATPTTQTPIITTATPRPTSKVNYSATIATMQSQIAEQNAKIEEQGSWIDQILSFLGLK